jgi:hypothetical protein
METWSPLSQSLRPARPPDEGKREAGRWEATLKAQFHERGGGNERGHLTCGDVQFRVGAVRVRD